MLLKKILDFTRKTDLVQEFYGECPILKVIGFQKSENELF